MMRHDLKKTSANKAKSLLDLPEEDLRARLAELVPRGTGEMEFHAIIDELWDSLHPDYAELAKVGVDAIDCCGTGGSGIPRFNTSTTVAFVLAAAGVPVAKFGNRAASSQSGSFDFLDAIGLSGSVSAESAAHMLGEEKLVFLYAPDAFPHLARLAPVRKSLGFPTVLNYVGPLLNPARPRYRLVGVSDQQMKKLAASYLSNLQQPETSAVIVRSQCGLDEICPRCGAASILVEACEVTEAIIETAGESHGSVMKTFCAADADGDDSREYTAQENARRFFSIIDGTDRSSKSYQLVLINSAVALNLVRQDQTLEDCRSEVKKLMTSGAVKSKYLQIRSAHEKYAQ